MAWYFPRHPFVVNGILDPDDINDNLTLAADEASFLSEGNWTSDAMAAMQVNTAVAHDSVISLYRRVERADPHSGSIDIPQSLSWIEVTDTSKTFESRGGKIEVDINFQIHNNPSSATSDQTGLMFAISLNGTPQLASLIGSGDLGNDQRQRPPNRYNGNTYAAVAATYFGTGPAVKAIQIGLNCHLTVRVPPGQHTVALVARNLALGSVGIRQTVSQRVVIIKDMWA